MVTSRSVASSVQKKDVFDVTDCFASIGQQEAVDADPHPEPPENVQNGINIQAEVPGPGGCPSAGTSAAGDCVQGGSSRDDVVASGSGYFAPAWNSPNIANLLFSSPSFLQYQQWKDQQEPHDLCPKIKVSRKSALKYSSILDNDVTGQCDSCPPSYLTRFFLFLRAVQKKLRLAANSGDTDLIRRLLDDGADPCACDHRNRTPLHFAACKGDVSVGESLSWDQMCIMLMSFRHHHAL